MRVARFWNVWPPSKFYEASAEDIALATEFYLEEMAIQAYQSKIDAKKQEQAMGKGGREALNLADDFDSD